MHSARGIAADARTTIGPRIDRPQTPFASLQCVDSQAETTSCNRAALCRCPLDSFRRSTACLPYKHHRLFGSRDTSRRPDRRFLADSLSLTHMRHRPSADPHTHHPLRLAHALSHSISHPYSTDRPDTDRESHACTSHPSPPAPRKCPSNRTDSYTRDQTHKAFQSPNTADLTSPQRPSSHSDNANRRSHPDRRAQKDTRDSRQHPAR